MSAGRLSLSKRDDPLAITGDEGGQEPETDSAKGTSGATAPVTAARRNSGRSDGSNGDEAYESNAAEARDPQGAGGPDTGEVPDTESEGASSKGDSDEAEGSSRTAPKRRPRKAKAGRYDDDALVQTGWRAYETVKGDVRDMAEELTAAGIPTSETALVQAVLSLRMPDTLDERAELVRDWSKRLASRRQRAA